LDCGGKGNVMLISEGLTSGKYKSVIIRKDKSGIFYVRTSKDEALVHFPFAEICLTDVAVYIRDGSTSFMGERNYSFFVDDPEDYDNNCFYPIDYCKRLINIKNLLDSNRTSKLKIDISPWWKFWKKDLKTFIIPKIGEWHYVKIKTPIVIEFFDTGIVFSSKIIHWDKKRNFIGCSECDLQNLEDMNKKLNGETLC
jgi:hypothetical protein